MSFEIEGLLHKKFDTENKTDTFQAREFVIETEDRGYKNYVKFQLTQDRCQLIDEYDEGEQIKVSFDLRGREWQGKYFTNLNAWRIDKPVKEEVAAPDSGGFPTADDPFGNLGESETSSDEELDDLPF